MKLSEEVERLHAQINTPEVLDFGRAVQLEAVHQRERWGVDHDAGKSDLDWNWTLAYLVNKALKGFGEAETFRKLADDHSDLGPEFVALMERKAAEAFEKGLHHQVTSAALIANWHSARKGGVGMVMRPGAEPPAGEAA
jgi:hypothetical protein